MNTDSIVIDPPRHFNSFDRDRLDTLVNKVDDKQKKPLRRFRVLLDSSNRNKTSYPNIYDYTIPLYEPIYGIERIELVRAFFPTSLYLLNSNNSSFRILVNGSLFTIPLTVGNYTSTELATELQDKLDTAGTIGTGWEVSVLPNSNKLQIYSANVTVPTITSFVVQGAEMPNLAPILGFGLADYTSVADTVTSPFPMNTSYPNNIVLQLKDDTQDFNSLTVPIPNNQQVRCFSYLPLGSGNGGTNVVNTSSGTVDGASIIVAGSSGLGGFGYFYISKDATNSYYDFYEGPKDRINKLSVRLQQILPNGSLVNPDFNNSDHIIELEMLARVDKSSLTY